ncbi:MAG: tetratricopeptide repeat protein [Planctomycetes bacterium]|nr:tetratricopeptide repeat protein [Planctomycetota bacterium]
MSGPVVFAFAVADGLVPVSGAAPYDVLARQLPRLLVARLNGDGDRGARFFPFLGPIDGKRVLLRPNQLFDPAVLVQVHKQGDVRLLSDGILRAGVLHWRVLDGKTGDVRLALDLPFDCRRPLDVLPRLEFELADRMGWAGRPSRLPNLAGEALGWFLVLKDELLRREANLVEPNPDPLRAARRCAELAAAEPEVQVLVGDFVAHHLRHREHRAACAQVLAPIVAQLPDDVTTLERYDALLLAAGDDASAATVACRAARLAPARQDLVERAAAQAFKVQRYDDVGDVVGRARAVGAASPAALAQHAAACDRTGDQATRAGLVRELVGMDDLPVPVARLVVSFLLEDEQPAMARTVVTRALQKDPEHAMLHFELGRACLLLDDGDSAASALQRALQIGLQPVVAGQARRFLRLSTVPGLWATTQLVEKAIAAADLAAALAIVRTFVRRAGRVAEAWFLYGLVLHKLGRLRRAERLLRRSLRHDHESPDAHNRLGILLVASGRVQEGHALLQRAHLLAPSDPSPLLHLAQACALLGRMAEADAHVDAAANRGADPRMVQAVRAEIHVGRT